MKKVAFLFLAVGSMVAVAAQSATPDFDPKHPPEPVCSASTQSLRASGTSKIVLRLTLDANGRVQSFKTESPRGLPLEKMNQPASAINSLQIKPAIKDGSPVAVQIDIEFDCADSPAYRTIPPKLIHNVPPVFPISARVGAGGRMVSVQLTVQADGTPKDVRIAKGVREDLDDSALDAVRQWKFQPAMRDGKPVEVTVVVAVFFDN